MLNKFRNRLLKSIMLKTMFLLCVSSVFSGLVLEKALLAEMAESKNHSPLKEKANLIKKKRVVTKARPSSKNKRKLASTAYSCSESYQDEYTPGYVQVGYGCEKGANLCLAVYRIERNRCEGDHLLRFFCDPQQERLFSFEKIKCKRGCSFQGLSSACIK